ncbi:MAG: endonuclease III [Deltaproteobacteria bacterium]|nr:endonuclease III [Deltaproteobacteria bacterium]
MLFKIFPAPYEMSHASLDKLEELIRSTGFYKNKALSLLDVSKTIVAKYNGKVPDNLENLISLRGVGRKTANVVLGNAFQIPGIVVDTHVGRLVRRMGFTKNTDPVKTEFDLMKIVSQKKWTAFSHLLIAHGRAVCGAARAYCECCPMSKFCKKVGLRS